MKYIQIVFCTVIIGFLGVIGFCTLDNRIPSSQDEMRSYTMFPELDYSRLTDVDYLNQIGDAFTDQMEWRWKFVKGYFVLNKNILKQTSLGDIVVGKEQVLFNKPIQVSSWKKYKENIKRGAKLLNDVAAEASKYGTKMIVVDAPRRDVALQNYVPSWYPDITEEYEECLEVQKEALDDSIEIIDVKELFDKNNPEGDNRYWYYNDHHINCRGGELVMSEIIRIVQKDYPQVEQKTLDDYQIIKRQVYGALNRKIGLSATAPDEELNLITRDGMMQSGQMLLSSEKKPELIPSPIWETIMVRRSSKQTKRICRAFITAVLLLRMFWKPCLSQALKICIPQT